MKNIKLFLLFLSLSCSFSFGQKELSAKDAVFNALTNNFDVEIAHKQVEVTEKNNSWGEAGLFPTVTLGAGFNNSIQDNTNNPFTFTPGIILNQNLSPSLSLSWNLFSGFRVKISKQRLELLEEQSEGNALIVIENTTQDVLKSYYSAQLQKARMDVFKDVMQVASKRMKLYQLKEKYSSASSLEIMQFKNQYLTDSTNYILQEISYKNAVRNLLIMMNEQDSTLAPEDVILTDSLAFTFPVLDREEVKQHLLANNKNLKNQYISQQLQERQTQLQRSFLYPTLTFQAGVSPSNSWLRDLKNPEFEVSTQTLQYFGNLNLRYTLFDNWKNKRAVEVAKIQEEINALSTQSMEKNLVSTLENLMDMYELRSGLLVISEENMEYATEAWRIALRRYETGSINSVELATFQSNFQNTLLQHYENLYNKLDAYLEIYKMTGNLSLDFLKR